MIQLEINSIKKFKAFLSQKLNVIHKENLFKIQFNRFLIFFSSQEFSHNGIFLSFPS